MGVWFDKCEEMEWNESLEKRYSSLFFLCMLNQRGTIILVNNEWTK